MFLMTDSFEILSSEIHECQILFTDDVDYKMQGLNLKKEILPYSPKIMFLKNTVLLSG